MLLVPLFHKAGTGRYANPPTFFDALFANTPKALLPGEPVPKERSYCFTFDDATSDFYTEVYPLLKKHHQRAVLAVPTGLINTSGYCTWKQLIEMEDSGHVECASHTVSHTKLLSPSPEIADSKRILAERLDRDITSFVYPYGTFTRAVHKEVLKHYSYVFRIGTACNFSWKNPIYRIPADNYPVPQIRCKLSHIARFVLHRARFR